MDYEQFRDRCHRLAEQHEAGDLAAAEQGWRELLTRDELPEMDRVMVLQNLAFTVAGAGRPDQAEQLFDQAIRRERPLCGGGARGGKALWLSRTGRAAEAAMVLEELAAEPWTTWREKLDYGAQADQLRGTGPTGPAHRT